MKHLFKILILIIIPFSFIIKNIEIIFLVSLSIISLFYSILNKSRVKMILKNKAILAYLFLMLWSMLGFYKLSQVNNYAYTSSVSPYLRMWIYLFIICYIFIFAFENEIEHKIQKLIIYSSILPNLLGIIQIKYPILTIIVSKEGKNRIASTFAHPNFYGYFLVFVILSLLYVIFNKCYNKYRWIYITYLIINYALLIYTHSRTTLFFGSFCILVYIIQHMTMLDKRLFIFLLSIGSIVVCIGLMFLFKSEVFIDSRYNVIEYSGSFTWRIQKWITSLDYMKMYPETYITGVGWMGSFYYAVNYLYINFGMHNEYIRVLFETGLPGLVFFILYITFVITSLASIKDKELRLYFGMFTFIFIVGCMDGNLISVPENTMYFLVIFSIIGGYSHRIKKYSS